MVLYVYKEEVVEMSFFMNQEIINNKLSEETKLLISKIELIENELSNNKKL